VVDDAAAGAPGAGRDRRGGDTSVLDSDAWFAPGQMKGVTQADGPEAVGSVPANRDVPAEFDDNPTRRCDVLGDQVSDQRLRARSEVEPTARSEGDGMFAKIERHRVGAEGGNGRGSFDVATILEFVVVDLVAER
jgi:hypothetical protein